jgi:hypothetical protein
MGNTTAINLMSIPALPQSIMDTLGATVRKVVLTISIAGQDVSTIIQNSMVHFLYKETVGDNAIADTLDITIADPEGLFRRTITLDAGSVVNGSLTMVNWNGPGTGNSTKVFSQMWINSFRIDKTKATGTAIRIGCTSINPFSPFRLQKKSQAFPQVQGQDDATSFTLKDAVAQVAKQDGLSVQYLASTNPTIQRTDQHDYSDAYQIERWCRDNDMVCVVKNNTMYIRDWSSMETQGSSGIFIEPTGLNFSGIEGWEFNETLEDIYGSSTSSYTDPTTGTDVKETVIDPNNKQLPDFRHELRTNPDGTTYDHVTFPDAPDD